MDQVVYKDSPENLVSSNMVVSSYLVSDDISYSAYSAVNCEFN